MCIDESGLNDKVTAKEVTIEVLSSHPLIKLAKIIDWERLKEIILPDLKASTHKGKWWLGRKLKVRIHLAIYILQQLYNLTDRKMEYAVKDNAAFQLFCGKGIVKKWHYPDHTKIEEFCSRLSSNTQNILANEIAKLAVTLGFAKVDCFDIDSTICEANMSYPSDSHMLLKLGKIANRLWSYVKTNVDIIKELDIPWDVNIKEIRAKARACFFDKKNKKGSLYNLWSIVCEEASKVREVCRFLRIEHLLKLPWYIQRAYVQINEFTQPYIADSIFYIFHGISQKGKALSFHLRHIACFNKNKANKKLEFGRNIQLGRITGNFLIVGKSTDVRMEDKKSLKPMIRLHQELFGQDTLSSFTADKGFYYNDNKQALIEAKVQEIGLQQPRLKGSLSDNIDKETRIKLINRRAGIEPLIGHAKHGGQLGKSRMKTDRTTLSGAYASIFGFNLRQLIRYETGKVKLQVA